MVSSHGHRPLFQRSTLLLLERTGRIWDGSHVKRFGIDSPSEEEGDETTTKPTAVKEPDPRTSLALSAAQPEPADDGRLVQIGPNEEGLCKLCEEREEASGGVDSG